MSSEAQDPALAVELAIESDLRSLGLEIDAQVVGQLTAYLGLLQKWNAAYNLTAIRDPQAMRVQHLADCLAVVPPLRRHLEKSHATGATQQRSDAALKVLDVGSGGGLPGVVLAVMQPQWQVHCIDAVAKKAAFIRQVAGELGLPNLHAHHGRVQDLSLGFGFDLVISRAFASLHDFVQWTQNTVAKDGVWVAMKGRHAEAAVGDRVVGDAQVSSIEALRPPGLDAERCLVWITQ